MHVVSLNVGRPQPMPYRGRTVQTAIVKTSTAARLTLRHHNLDGDEQADLRVHGGPDKAVYGYPSEHYAWWASELPGIPLPWGIFGENLTLVGLLETEVHIGDEFRVGTARLQVTQPRMPCFKLGLRFGDQRMVKRFLNSRRPGIYFRIVETGTIAVDDPIECLAIDDRRLSVAALLDLIIAPTAPADQLHRALAIPALAACWREEFAARIAGVETAT